MQTIPLSQGLVALVDDDLYPELNRFKWYAKKDRKTFYAVRNVCTPDGHKTLCLMHREVFRLKGEVIPPSVDHRDRDGLNNQRENLRPASRLEQNYNQGKKSTNSSGFNGVSWNKDRHKWKAKAAVARKQYHLGYFDDPFSAAWVRDSFVREHHGEFASLNNLVDRRKESRPVAVERRAASITS